MKFWPILWSFALAGCAGYQFVTDDNPFAQYQIKSVSVPMFFNKSTLPHTSKAFTTEFFKLLTSYRDLKVYSGLSPKADAVLLGIISSPQYLNKTVVVEGRKKVQTLVSPGDIGKRNDFFTPTRNKLSLTLKVVLIKNPKHTDLEFFQQEIAQHVTQHPKLVLNEVINLSTSFDREFKSLGAGGESNFTNNLGTLNEAIRTLATQGRNYFKEIVINAF